MFESVRNFFYRHRRKFLIGGSIVGGVVLLSRYAEYKLFQWHESQTRALIEKQMRRQHYEKTRETAHATALSLSSSLSKIVSNELEIDELLLAISSKPENKKIYWEELKIMGFTRAVVTIYTPAIVSCIVHAKLMVLGSYTFGEVNQSEDKIDTECQEKFLARLQHFIERGLPRLIKNIQLATQHHVRLLPLNQTITLDRLEAILKDVTLTLSGEEGFSCIVKEVEESFVLNPWSQYLIEGSLSDINCIEDPNLRKMTLEVMDIVDSEDFNAVVQNLVQSGLNHVLDTVADSFPYQKEFKSDSATESDSNESLAQVNPLSQSTLPVAKLVPVLCNVVSPCLSPAPGQLLQSALLNERLENLSFNVYEAFSSNI